MPAQRGKDLLLKIDRGTSTPALTVGGLRATAIQFDARTVDATNQDSPGLWRELLAGAGVRTARITGSGIFKDQASDILIRQTFFAAQILRWLIVVPDFGTIAGPFQIANLEIAGRHDGEVTFDLALESAGEITFTEV